VITIYLTLDIFTFILTGNLSAVRVASDFKTWVTHIVAAVSTISRQVYFQGQVVRGVFVGLQTGHPSVLTALPQGGVSACKHQCMIYKVDRIFVGLS